MKNNKIDSEILDDNFFAEEKENEKNQFKPPQLNDEVESIFRVVGYLILNTTFHIFSLFFLFIAVYPILISFNFMTETLGTLLTLLLSYSPFLFWLSWEIKEENFLNSNKKIWTAIFTSLIFIFIGYILFKFS
ncbi:MAG: hypothetical protein AB8H03_03250 [Saprospiraceae bacterium]